MNDIFITAININKVRHIENFNIPLSETERKHLIITGKNGSGKTSLIKQIKESIAGLMQNYSSDNISLNLNKQDFRNDFDTGKYITAFFESKRLTSIQIPQGINKVNLQQRCLPHERLNHIFIQYIVNLRAERAFARDDNDEESIKKINEWFERFEHRLKDLFDAPDLKLVFDRKHYNFYIEIPNHEPFTLTELSDGYSAVLTIVTELIMRMEATGNQAYDVQGVVLIDEIETHLHVALQKKIMPFLCDFFPKIQFIVTTHSPFVLSSINNAVVCDLETREVINSDLSGYSYDALVESYFDTDKYSEEVKTKLAIFEQLSDKTELNEEEQDLYEDLNDYFNNLPTFRADELAVKLQQIKLKKLTSKK